VKARRQIIRQTRNDEKPRRHQFKIGIDRACFRARDRVREHSAAQLETLGMVGVGGAKITAESAAAGGGGGSVAEATPLPSDNAAIIIPAAVPIESRLKPILKPQFTPSRERPTRSGHRTNF